MARGPPGTPWVVLVLVLVCALAVGVAASTLAQGGPSPILPNAGGSPSSISALVGYAVVIGLAALVGFLLYRRLTSASAAVPGRFVAMVLAAVLLGAAFAALAPFLTGGCGFLCGTGPPPGNGGPSGGSSGSNISGNVTGPGIELPLLKVVVPPWTLIVAILVVALVAATLATPQARELLFARGKSRPKTPAQQAQEARAVLSAAASEIEEGGDPRQVIIARYGELLRRIGPSVGDLDPSTPEEIRAQHLVRLGIRPEAAGALTRLFEEARYSTHPMGPADAARAVEVLRAAESDLAGDRPLP